MAEAEVEEVLVVEVSRLGEDIVVVTEAVDGDLLHTRLEMKKGIRKTDWKAYDRWAFTRFALYFTKNGGQSTRESRYGIGVIMNGARDTFNAALQPVFARKTYLTAGNRCSFVCS